VSADVETDGIVKIQNDYPNAKMIILRGFSSEFVTSPASFTTIQA
jgi:hypothetical protein